MSAAAQTSRVVVVGDLSPTHEQIRAALLNQEEFQLIDIVESSERLIRELAAANPDLILVENSLEGQPTVDILDDIAQQFPFSPIVAILPENDPTLIQQVILAGARAFLVHPFTQINLQSTLRRVRDLERRRARIAGSSQRVQEATRPLQSVAVFSPRGGVGTSTLAVNTAIALQEELNQRILLVEGKFYFGHLRVMLNVRSQNTIADLIPHVSSLDEGLIGEVVIPHSTGIHILLGPNNLQIGQGIRPDDVFTIYSALKRYFDFIVVDCGSNLTENTVTFMDASDRVVLVGTPDLAGLHDTSSFIQLSRSLGYPPEKLLIALNRDQMLGGVKSADIETALHRPLDFKIPDDAANAVRSINRGIPLLMRYPRSPASRAMKQMALQLANMQTGELAALPEMPMDQSKQEALLASSYLG